MLTFWGCVNMYAIQIYIGSSKMLFEDALDIYGYLYLKQALITILVLVVIVGLSPGSLKENKSVLAPVLINIISSYCFLFMLHIKAIPISLAVGLPSVLLAMGLFLLWSRFKEKTNWYKNLFISIIFGTFLGILSYFAQDIPVVENVLGWFHR